MSSGASPRLLAIMGSGETSPTMTATHRELFGRLGEQVPAVLLETPTPSSGVASTVTGHVAV